MKVGWHLSEPDVEIVAGELHRTYHLTVADPADKVVACAQLCVAFWMAPRPPRVTVELWPRFGLRR